MTEPIRATRAQTERAFARLTPEQRDLDHVATLDESGRAAILDEFAALVADERTRHVIPNRADRRAAARRARR